jgi:predicted dehydrogenase
MGEIGIGIVGGGYMGKAHAVAMAAVGAVFDTGLRPRLEMVSAAPPRFGASATAPLTALRAPPPTGASWCRSAGRGRHHRLAAIHPPRHCRGGLRARQAGVCEKPWAQSAGRQPRHGRSGRERRGQHGRLQLYPHAGQPFARKLIAEGAIGDVTWFRGEHTEDFYADPDKPPSWRTDGRANGTMGDLAPHMINCALALLGPIARADRPRVETVHATRPGGVTVTMMIRPR